MYWLGIDVGSISTDLVMMSNNGELAESLYLKTGSKPINAIKTGLKTLGERYDDDEIAGVGITGSGRHLGGAVVGADIIKNEITAHGRAVEEIDKEIKTVIEIGGQDSKLILMKDGMVMDFAMNTVCAAGTGSFLDRQATRMGYTIEEMSEMAARATRVEEIAGRCAVFAETDIIHKQQVGAKEDELMAGMCKALAVTYMSNVAKGKKLMPKICFQGGVASNKGMVKAFEDILQTKLFVPKEHKVMGAYGAALLAKEKSSGTSRFKGFELGVQELELYEIKCSDCSNSCVVTTIRNGKEVHGYIGDRCGKYSSGNVRNT